MVAVWTFSPALGVAFSCFSAGLSAFSFASVFCSSAFSSWTGFSSGLAASSSAFTSLGAAPASVLACCCTSSVPGVFDSCSADTERPRPLITDTTSANASRNAKDFLTLFRISILHSIHSLVSLRQPAANAVGSGDSVHYQCTKLPAQKQAIFKKIA